MRGSREKGNYRTNAPRLSCLVAVVAGLGLVVAFPRIGLAQGAQNPQPAGAEKFDPDKAPLSSSRPRPAAEAILATNPTLPWECARAAKILADLGELDLAKGFLRKILASLQGQSEIEKRDTLVDFENRFGVEMFFDMVRHPGLQPEAGELFQALVQALDSYRRDTDRLRKLVSQLAADDAREALQAAEELRRSRGFSVAPIVEWLVAGTKSGQPHPPQAVDRALAVIRQLKEEAVGPLLGILRGGPKDWAAQAAFIAGRLRIQELGPFLIEPACGEVDPALKQQAGEALRRIYGESLSAEVGANLLIRHVKRLLSEIVTADPGATGEWWEWDPAVGLPIVMTLRQVDIARRKAAALADDAGKLMPNSELVQLYRLITAAEVAAGTGTLREIAEAASRMDQSWTQLSCGQLVQAYGLSQQHQLSAGGAVILALLARRSGDRLLISNHVDPSPLVEGLRHQDRRIRYFAVAAVLQHARDCHYAGASWLGEAVKFLLASEGKSRVLIGTPNTPEAMAWAGFFIQLGFEVETARTGRDVFRLLTSSPDFELAFLDLTLDDPPLDTLVQQLAADCRTAPVPIGIWGRAGTFERAKQIADRNPVARAFARPHSLDSIKWQVDELRPLARGGLLTSEERRWVAQSLLEMLAADVDRASRLVPLGQLEPTLTVQLGYPERARPAMLLLANIGSASAQTKLVEFASRQGSPVPLRQEAVKIFADTVARHGLLLTTKEIQRQYDLYNQLGPLDPQERQILGALLDAIEGESATSAPEGQFSSLRQP